MMEKQTNPNIQKSEERLKIIEKIIILTKIVNQKKQTLLK